MKAKKIFSIAISLSLLIGNGQVLAVTEEDNFAPEIIVDDAPIQVDANMSCSIDNVNDDFQNVNLFNADYEIEQYPETRDSSELEFIDEEHDDIEIVTQEENNEQFYEMYETTSDDTIYIIDSTIYYGDNQYYIKENQLYRNEDVVDVDNTLEKIALRDNIVYAIFYNDGEEQWQIVDDSLSSNEVSLYSTADNELTIYNFAKNTMGVNTAAACGIVANIYYESGFNPTSSCIDTNGLTSYGICQWNGGRFTALKNYCSSRGYNYRTISAQLQYLKYELEGSEKSAYSKIRNVENSKNGAYNAGYNWARYFERCASKYYTQRAVRSRDTYWSKYGNGSSSPTAPSPNSGCAVYQVNTSSSNLNMRSGAGTGYSKVTSVPKGTYLQVSRVANADGYTWGYTSYGNRSGWVALNYCKYISGSISSGPGAYNINYYTALRAGQPQMLKITYNGATNATIYVCDSNFNVKIKSNLTSSNTDVKIVNLSSGTYKIYMDTWNSGGTYYGRNHNNVATFTVQNAVQYLQNGSYVLIPQCAPDKALTTNGTSNGAQTKIYSFSGANTQRFTFTYLGNGLYKIKSDYSGKCLDVYGAASNNGTPVDTYTDNGTIAQQWYVADAGNGYYYVGSACNLLALDVNGASSANNTKVQMWSGNTSSAQKWKIQPAGTQTISNGRYSLSPMCATNKSLYVSGGSASSGANVCIYTYTNTASKQFNLRYAGNGYYYIINANSGKYLDVAGGKMTSGTNVQQYTGNGSDAQKWVIRYAGNGYYYIISKINGLYLDVNGAVNTNGANVQVYTGNGSTAQRWKLTSR